MDLCLPYAFASHVALLGGLHFMVLRGMLLCALFPMFALPCVRVCACVRVCVRVCVTEEHVTRFHQVAGLMWW